MTDVWEQLAAHRSKTEQTRIQSLFQNGPDRFETFSARSGDILLDFSKTSIDQTALNLLLDLAQSANLSQKIEAMFAGETINSTENRAVLHTALRAAPDTKVSVDGQDIIPAIQHTLHRMTRFAEAVRSGHHSGASGKRFTDVVHIGIGGSDLGPVMATCALAPYHDGPRCHFVSNVDGAHIHDTLKDLNAETTLVVIASKTFTTIETMTNAETAIAWLRTAVGEAFGQHLAAVSSAPEKTAEFGIDPQCVFGFEDWVGGRYSVWGPVGLPLMIAIGPDHFQGFLNGATDIDQHFRSASLHENLPVLMGLVGIWHNNICGYRTRAVLPYDQRLSRLPAYLQQLDMESNGKRVDLNGTTLERHSGPVIWGEPGTNGQHAFFQLLHQGTQIIPAEFLIAAEGHEPDLAHQHDLLKANCLAQSEALMRGRSSDQARDLASKRGFEGQQVEKMAAHLTFPGNRPSMTLAYPKLTPFVLGQLIALFEHRVFTEGAIWGINSFDQWGVELGKELANGLLPMVQGLSSEGKDPSTRGLLAALSFTGTKSG